LDHPPRFTVTKRVWWYCVVRFALTNYILLCRLGEGGPHASLKN